MKRWPLAVSPFTWFDRLRVAAWLLSTDKYTMGAKVAEFEQKMSQFSGMHAVAVSSGSAANTLLFETWKAKNPDKTATVICPAVTWGSSVSTAIMAGFEIEFCDINLNDFCFDYDMLAEMLKRHRRRKDHRTIIWPTALIGYVPDFATLNALADKYGAELYLDSCENTLSRDAMGNSILGSCRMTTTSCYFAHQIVSIELGFAFYRSGADADLGRMLRNHGLTRSLPYNNPTRMGIEGTHADLDPEFLFALPGTNHRPTELNACFGLIDFERRELVRDHRSNLFEHYAHRLRAELGDRYFLPPDNRGHVPFCLPVFVKSAGELNVLKARLRFDGVDTRPVVGGCLPMHPAFRKYGAPALYPNALWVHAHGLYIGMHRRLTEADIDRLITILGRPALQPGQIEVIAGSDVTEGEVVAIHDDGRAHSLKP